jgi:hypothetical protein
MMIEIIGIAILCNLVTHWFEPIQKIKYKVVDKLPMWIAKLFLCSKCMGLWVGLIYFQDPILAAVTSFTSYLIDNAIYNIELWKNKN